MQDVTPNGIYVAICHIGVVALDVHFYDRPASEVLSCMFVHATLWYRAKEKIRKFDG